MTLLKTYHLFYYNIPTKVCGIVVFDSESKAQKYMEDLSKWNDTTVLYSNMVITGPHDHMIG